jgi:hypothetical protein
MKRKTMATQSTTKHRPMVGHLIMDQVVLGSTPSATNQSKGSRLTSNGSKDNVWQGSKRQVRKDVTRGIIARECPAESYVSSFLNRNFAGFLSGRIQPLTA